MPTYNFINNDSGEEIEVVMSMHERDQFVIDNPQLTQVIRQAPALCDPVRVGVRSKPDDGFKDVLKGIKNKHRRSNINTF